MRDGKLTSPRMERGSKISLTGGELPYELHGVSFACSIAANPSEPRRLALEQRGRELVTRLRIEMVKVGAHFSLRRLSFSITSNTHHESKGVSFERRLRPPQA